MKVGDMVVRAYAFHGFIPGIIVEEKRQDITSEEFDEETTEPWSYEQISFTVAWSDGQGSSETAEELEYLENAIAMGWNENR